MDYEEDYEKDETSNLMTKKTKALGGKMAVSGDDYELYPEEHEGGKKTNALAGNITLSGDDYMLSPNENEDERKTKALAGVAAVSGDDYKLYPDEYKGDKKTNALSGEINDYMLYIDEDEDENFATFEYSSDEGADYMIDQAYDSADDYFLVSEYSEEEEKNKDSIEDTYEVYDSNFFYIETKDGGDDYMIDQASDLAGDYFLMSEYSGEEGKSNESIEDTSDEYGSNFFYIESEETKKSSSRTEKDIVTSVHPKKSDLYFSDGGDDYMIDPASDLTDEYFLVSEYYGEEGKNKDSIDDIYKVNDSNSFNVESEETEKSTSRDGKVIATSVHPKLSVNGGDDYVIDPASDYSGQEGKSNESIEDTIDEYDSNFFYVESEELESIPSLTKENFLPENSNGSKINSFGETAVSMINPANNSVDEYFLLSEYSGEEEKSKESIEEPNEEYDSNFIEEEYEDHEKTDGNEEFKKRAEDEQIDKTDASIAVFDDGEDDPRIIEENVDVRGTEELTKKKIAFLYLYDDENSTEIEHFEFDDDHSEKLQVDNLVSSLKTDDLGKDYNMNYLKKSPDKKVKNMNSSTGAENKNGDAAMQSDVSSNTEKTVENQNTLTNENSSRTPKQSFKGTNELKGPKEPGLKNKNSSENQSKNNQSKESKLKRPKKLPKEFKKNQNTNKNSEKNSGNVRNEKKGKMLGKKKKPNKVKKGSQIVKPKKKRKGNQLSRKEKASNDSISGETFEHSEGSEGRNKHENKHNISPSLEQTRKDKSIMKNERRNIKNNKTTKNIKPNVEVKSEFGNDYNNDVIENSVEAAKNYTNQLEQSQSDKVEMENISSIKEKQKLGYSKAIVEKKNSGHKTKERQVLRRKHTEREKIKDISEATSHDKKNSLPLKAALKDKMDGAKDFDFFLARRDAPNQKFEIPSENYEEKNVVGEHETVNEDSDQSKNEEETISARHKHYLAVNNIEDGQKNGYLLKTRLNI